MKKTIFSMLALPAIVFTLTSCGGAAAKKDGGSNVSSNDANTIITYTNSLLDASKNYAHYTEDYVNYYGRLLKKWGGSEYTVTNRPGGIYHSIGDEKSVKLAFGTPPAALGNNAQFFKDTVSAYKTLHDKFVRQDSLLKVYIDAENFKDDKYAKGKEWISSQQEIAMKMDNLQKSINQKIETVADAAEAVILEGNPLKENYIATKADLKLFDNLILKINSKETFTAEDIASINADYAALIARITKNAAVDKAKLDKEKMTDKYSRLYTNYNENANKLKAIIRNIADTKHLSESDYSKLDNLYSDLVSNYNYWVN